MKILKNTYLTGNPDIDKYLITTRPGLFDFYEEAKDSYIYFYALFNNELDTKEFKTLLETVYPEGFMAALNTYLKIDATSDTFSAFYEKIDIVHERNIYNFAITCVTNKIWLAEIADFLLKNPYNIFWKRENENLVHNIIIRTKDETILNKILNYPEPRIQEEARNKLNQIRLLDR